MILRTFIKKHNKHKPPTNMTDASEKKKAYMKAYRAKGGETYKMYQQEAQRKYRLKYKNKKISEFIERIDKIEQTLARNKLC
jgi:hypothetical protein